MKFSQKFVSWVEQAVANNFKKKGPRKNLGPKYLKASILIT